MPAKSNNSTVVISLQIKPGYTGTKKLLQRPGPYHLQIMDTTDNNTSYGKYTVIKPDETLKRSPFKRWLSERMYNFSSLFQNLFGYHKASGNSASAGILIPATIHLVPRKPRVKREVES